MKLEDWIDKNLKVKWFESEQGHIEVIQKEPPQDTSDLYVIGTCGECAKSGECDIAAFIHINRGHTKDFGCIHFEAKGIFW